MSQEQVYNFLELNPTKWFTSKQISERIGISRGISIMNLKKLRCSEFVKYKREFGQIGFLYKYKEVSD